MISANATASFTHPTVMRLLLVCGLAAILLAAPPVLAQYRTLTPEAGQDGPKRAALVLGNAAYTHATPLQNAVNDAADMAAVLRDVGFTVVTGTDLSLRDMRGALNDFTEAARGAEVALVFFAGHGVEVGGENYLVPVDADIRARADVAYEALPAGQVLARADEAVGDGLAVLMLDACRNDPFRAWRSANGGGLSAMNGPSGSVIAYATAPGDVASDNPRGRNGLYTEVLLEELARPGLEFSELLRDVGGIVADRSGGEQQPWVAASYVGNLYLVPGEGNDTPAPPRAEPGPPPVRGGYQPPADHFGLYRRGELEDEPRAPLTLEYEMVGTIDPSWPQARPGIQTYRIGYRTQDGRAVRVYETNSQNTVSNGELTVTAFSEGEVVLDRHTLAPLRVHSETRTEVEGYPEHNTETFNTTTFPPEEGGRVAIGSGQYGEYETKLDTLAHLHANTFFMVLSSLPLVEGQTFQLWAYDDGLNRMNPTPLVIDVAVGGRETVSTPAGTFETHAVTWSYDFLNLEIVIEMNVSLDGPRVPIRWILSGLTHTLTRIQQ